MTKKSNLPFFEMKPCVVNDKRLGPVEEMIRKKADKRWRRLKASLRSFYRVEKIDNEIGKVLANDICSTPDQYSQAPDDYVKIITDEVINSNEGGTK